MGSEKTGDTEERRRRFTSGKKWISHVKTGQSKKYSTYRVKRTKKNKQAAKKTENRKKRGQTKVQGNWGCA